MNARSRAHSHLSQWIAALAACTALAGLARAQPLAIGAVAPPARVDTVLRGSVLASLRAVSPAACLAECKRVQGCTGYNFAAPGPGPELPGSPGGKLGAAVDPRAANCTLLRGALSDAPTRGVVSCRMPCSADAAGPVATPQPLPGASVHDPNLALGRPPLSKLQPAASAQAPAALLATPAPVIVGTYTPPPPPPRPAPPPPPPPPPPRPASPAPAPAPAPAVVRTGVSGYEVVSGPEINVAPLAYTVASAQCPVGKVALSAAYSFTASGFASFGLEVRGAMPDGRTANVWMRNANVVDAAKGRAIAVCVNDVAGLRVVDSWTESLDDRVNPSHLTCTGRERLVGGGVMAGNDTHITANAPQRWGDPGTWLVEVIRSSPLAGQDRIRTRALCAPEAAVDGWEVIQSARVGLGGRSQRMLLQTCPGSKVLLAGGVLQSSGPPLDMVVSTLGPQGPIAWSTEVKNRNTGGASSQIEVVFAAICARRQ